MSSTTTAAPAAAATSAASCYTAVPQADGYVPAEACNSNYDYSPSFPAAILFAVLFGLTLSAHVYQAIRYRKFRLCWVVIMCGLWEFVSFALRAVGSKNQQSTPVSFASQLLVLLAPLWLNAFDYMVLGRMVHYFVLPEQRLWGIRARRLATFFVCADIFSFLTQLGGGSLIQSGEAQSLLMTGIHIYMGGIGLQQAFILVFTAFAFRFRTVMLRARRNGTDGSDSERRIADCEATQDSSNSSSAGFTDDANGTPTARKTRWDLLLYALLASLFLITVRIIYRLVEFSAGDDASSNPVPFHEWYFYVFDALPMFLALVVMNLFHPGRTLVGLDSEFPKGLSRKEKRAAKETRREEKRTLKEEKRAARGQGRA